MDCPSDQLLAGAGLAVNQDGRVRGGDAADLVEHGGQCRAPADDLLEVVDRLDLLLEVEVLLGQAGTLGLGQHPGRDVDPDRMHRTDRPVVAAHRPHPEVDPERASVPSTHLQFQPRDLLPAEPASERWLGPLPAKRRVLKMLHDARAEQILRGIAEEFRGGAVHADQAEVRPERHVSIRRLLVEVAIAALALDQPLLDPQPLQLDGGAGGEDLEDEKLPRLGRHGPLVEHGQMPEDVPLAIEQRDAEIALDPQVDQSPVLRKLPLDPQGMVAEPPANHVLAGRPCEIEFDVREDLAPAPVREGPDVSRGPGELGDERETDTDRRREVLDERLEEDLARAPRRPLDDGPQCGDLVIDRRRKRSHPVFHRQHSR